MTLGDAPPLRRPGRVCVILLSRASAGAGRPVRGESTKKGTQYPFKHEPKPFRRQKRERRKKHLT